MVDFFVVVLSVLLYGFVHSLLASLAVKDWFRTRLAGTRRYYRLAYNFIGGLTFLPVLALVAARPGLRLYLVPSPGAVFMSAIQGLAVVLLLAGLFQTDWRAFLGLRQLVTTAEDAPQELVISGLYHWVRHPLYTAGLLFIWFTPLMTSSLLAMNLGLTIYIIIGTHFEERKLRREFGQAYADYCLRTPMLIPRLPKKT